MTDLAFAAGLGLRDGTSPAELSLWLARTPIKPVGYGSPDELSVELFAACGVAWQRDEAAQGASTAWWPPWRSGQGE